MAGYVGKPRVGPIPYARIKCIYENTLSTPMVWGGLQGGLKGVLSLQRCPPPLEALHFVDKMSSAQSPLATPKLHGMQQVASRRFPCELPQAILTLRRSFLFRVYYKRCPVALARPQVLTYCKQVCICKTS